MSTNERTTLNSYFPMVEQLRTVNSAE